LTIGEGGLGVSQASLRAADAIAAVLGCVKPAEAVDPADPRRDSAALEPLTGCCCSVCCDDEDAAPANDEDEDSSSLSGLGK